LGGSRSSLEPTWCWGVGVIGASCRSVAAHGFVLTWRGTGASGHTLVSPIAN
jgi:hypothetical protein